MFPIILFSQVDNVFVEDSVHYFYWNTETNNWKYHIRYIYKYDNKGNLIDKKVYQGVSNDQLLSQSHYTYSYLFDSIGNQIEKISYNWDMETAKLNYGLRLTYEYDNKSRLNKEVNYYWNKQNNEWDILWLECESGFGCDGGLKLYSYDSTANYYVINYYDWISGENNWIINENFYETCTYDSIGNLVERFIDNGGLKERAIYFYDSLGNQSDLIVYLGDNELPEFSHHCNYIYEIDGKIKERYEYEYMFYNDFNDTTNLYLETYKYDIYDNLTEKIHYAWDSENNIWQKELKYVYYWSQLSTQIEENNFKSDIIIYPNPSFDKINIAGLTKSSEIKIYNINGQLIKSFQQVNNAIDISELNAGVYIINLTSNDKTFVRKLIKE